MQEGLAGQVHEGLAGHCLGSEAGQECLAGWETVGGFVFSWEPQVLAGQVCLAEWAAVPGDLAISWVASALLLSTVQKHHCMRIIAPTSIAETGALPDRNNKWLNSLDAVHFACVFEGLYVRLGLSQLMLPVSTKRNRCFVCKCCVPWCGRQAFTANTQQVPGWTNVSLTSCHSPVDGFFDDPYLPVTGPFPMPTAKKVALRLDAMVFYRGGTVSKANSVLVLRWCPIWELDDC